MGSDTGFRPDDDGRGPCAYAVIRRSLAGMRGSVVSTLGQNLAKTINQCYNEETKSKDVLRYEIRR